MSRSTMTEAMKEALCGELVTLNGHKAIVTGWRNHFATVQRIDNAETAQFDWLFVSFTVKKRAGKFMATRQVPLDNCLTAS